MSPGRTSLGALALLFAGCAALSGLDELGPDDVAERAAEAGTPASSSGGPVPTTSSTPPPPALEAGAEAGVDACLGKDLQGDGKNCGGCGHDCFGGACTAAKCEPVEIVKGLTGTIGVAVGGDAIYFGTGTSLHRAGFDGKGDVEVVGNVGPKYVATTATHVYWADGSNTVMRWPIAGGAPETIVTDVANPLGIGVDADHVYFTHYSADGGVERALLGGGGREALLGNFRHPEDVDVSGGEVYVGSDGVNELAAYSVGNKRVLSKGLGPTAATVDGNDVWFVQQGDATIQHIAAGGGVKEVVAKTTGTPCGIASSKDSIYWVACGGTSVVRLAR